MKGIVDGVTHTDHLSADYIPDRYVFTRCLM